MGDVLLVRGIQCIANLRSILQCLIERLRPLQWSSFNELHHQIIWLDVVEVADMRMIERCDRTGLTFKTLAELGLRNP